MKKLTKLLSVFVIAGVVGTGVATVAACNTEEEAHQHTYTYTDNGDGKHTKKCKDGDYEITEDHVDGNSDSKCDNCGATLSQSGPVNQNSVTKVEISGGKEVAVKGTLTLTATVTATGNAATTVTWSSSDEGKATVANGVVTGVAEGEVTITATSTYDNTKKATYTITVKPEGSVIITPDPVETIPTYEELLAKSNKLYANDFTEGTVGTYSGNSGVAGVYSDKDGFVTIADGVLKHVSEKGSNSNIIVDLGTLETGSTFEGYMEVTADDMGSAWNLVQFRDGSNNIVLSIGTGTDKTKIAYAVKSGITEKDASNTTVNVSGAVVTDIAATASTNYKIYYKFNLETGAITLDINGKTISIADADVKGVAIVYMTSSNSGKRHVSVDNLVFCGTEMTLESYKTAANATIDAELAKYDTAEYVTNGADLTAAVATAKQAVTDANDVAGVNQAIANCKAALAAVLKDSDIAAARTNALNALKEKYPATKFTITGLEGDDAKYNNVSLYGPKIEEVEGALADKNSAAEMKAVTDEAEEYLATKTDAAMLTAKISDAKTALATYAETYKETLTGADAEAKQAAVDKALPTQQATLDGAESIADVNTKSAAAEAALRKAADNVGADPATVVAEAQADVDSYKATEIAVIESDYDAYVTLITTAKTTAKESLSVDAVDEVDGKVTAAKAEVDRYLANYAAHKAADAYKTQQAATVKNDTVKAEIEALNFLETFKEVKKTEDKTAAEVREAATGSANQKVDDLVAKLTTYQVKVSIGEEACYVTYGTKLTLSHLHVSGFNVSEATLNGKAVPETASDDEDLTVYNPVTVVVTGKTAIEGFKTNESLPLEAVTEITYLPTTIVDNNLFTASADLSEINKQAFKVSAGLVNVGTTNQFAKVTIGTDYTTVVSLQNISGGANNEAYPLTITAKCALSSLSAKIICADTKGTSKRAGKIHILVNGEERIVTSDVIWGASANDKLTGIKAGDIVTIWIENTSGSGGHFYIADISAEADGSKIDKTVTVTWGTVTESYHYFEAITAPEPTGLADNEKLDYWYYMDGETEVKWVDGTVLPEGNHTYTAKLLTVAAVESVEVSAAGDATTLDVGGSLNLTATVKDADGNVLTDRTVTWSVGDYAYAEVKDGVLKLLDGAQKDDSITVTATVGSKSASVTITVTKPDTVPDAIDISTDTKTSGHAISFASEGGYFTVTGVNNYKYVANILGGGALIGTSKGRGLTVKAGDNVESITIVIKLGLSNDSNYNDISTGSAATVTGAQTGTISSAAGNEVVEYSITLKAGESVTITGDSNIALVGATATVVPKA